MKKLVLTLAAAAAFVVPVASPAVASAQGYGTSVSVENEPPGDNCPNGGIKVTQSTPEYGVLWDQYQEESSVFYVCNGSNGVNGLDGTNGSPGSNGAKGADGKDGAAAPSCTSKRSFVIRIREPKGHHLSSATVTANGKTVNAHRHRDGRLVARADFTGVVAQKGQVVPVLVQGTDHGKKVSAVRLYRLCTPNAGVLNLPIVL